jgi:hypothetical protein
VRHTILEAKTQLMVNDHGLVIHKLNYNKGKRHDCIYGI